MEGRILVPLDGSDLAERVLPHAILLARATHGGLRLVRAVAAVEIDEWSNRAGPKDDGDLGPLYSPIDVAQAYLDGMAAQIGHAGLPVTTEVRRGDPAREIIAAAESGPPTGLIAMATHGRGGLGRWLYGSVAHKVLQASPLPLLLLRVSETAPAAVPARYRTLLVPLDGSPGSEAALRPAAELAAGTGAELLLIYAGPTLTDVAVAGSASLWLLGEYERQEHQMRDTLDGHVRRLRAQGVAARHAILHGPPAETILHAAADEVDLVVMATHGRGGWERLVYGSVAARVVEQTTRPILLVPVRPVPERPAVAAVERDWIEEALVIGTL